MKFKAFLESKGYTEESFAALTDAQAQKVFTEYLEAAQKSISEMKANGATKAELTAISDSLTTVKESLAKLPTAEKLTALQSKLDKQQEDIDTIREAGGAAGKGKNEFTIAKGLAPHHEQMKAVAQPDADTGKFKNMSFTVKASHNPTDIGDRSQYGEFLNDTGKAPFRKMSISGLFKRRPITKEHINYREQATITRDGKTVIACATSTHNSAITWALRTEKIGKIRDFTDICLDMMDDYDFVEGEIKELVTQGVDGKEDSAVLLGDGEVIGIDTIASEFDAANVLAVYTGKFQAPNLAELTAAMKAQIFTFGAENAWDSNVILMNHNDFVVFMHNKDKNDNYLLPNFVMSNGGMLNGMRIVTSPLVSANSLYVMDTEQAVILDRMTTKVDMFFENKDNAEHELVTVKALKRMQFFSRLLQQNAFMKCSDIAAALTAITKP